MFLWHVMAINSGSETCSLLGAAELGWNIHWNCTLQESLEGDAEGHSKCMVVQGVKPSPVLVWNMNVIFPSYRECHDPNWGTPSFFRGVCIPPTRSPVLAMVVWYERDIVHPNAQSPQMSATTVSMFLDCAKVAKQQKITRFLTYSSGVVFFFQPGFVASVASVAFVGVWLLWLYHALPIFTSICLSI